MSDKINEQNNEKEIKTHKLMHGTFHNLLNMGTKIKRKDWGDGKYIYMVNGVIYYRNPLKPKKYDQVWENSQAELLAEDYIVYKEN